MEKKSKIKEVPPPYGEMLGVYGKELWKGRDLGEREILSLDGMTYQTPVLVCTPSPCCKSWMLSDMV